MEINLSSKLFRKTSNLDGKSKPFNHISDKGIKSKFQSKQCQLNVVIMSMIPVTSGAIPLAGGPESRFKVG